MTIPSPGPYEAETMSYPVSIPRKKTGPARLRLSEEDQTVFEEMVAMRLPHRLIANRLGLSIYQLSRRIRPEPGTPRRSTPFSPEWRAARTERIRRHIADYPGRSLFESNEAAA